MADGKSGREARKDAHNEISIPHPLVALLPIAATIGLLCLQLFVFDDFTPHIPLLLGTAITALVARARGCPWQQVQDGAFAVISVALPAMFCLVMVGMLVATWIASGTVPALIYFGLLLIDPNWFLAACLLLCSVVSLCIGTSWTTTGTVGLALMGIGEAFGVPAHWVAGAVVSGAFFGDKISPLSDTTNLAAAVTETDVFAHIRNMMPTTIPAMLVALVIYLIFGASGADSQLQQVAEFKSGLQAHFDMGALQLLPLAVVLCLAFCKVAPIPALFSGVLAGGLVAFVSTDLGLHDLFVIAHSGYSIETGMAAMDSLLNRGGIMSMTWIIMLVIFALGFGGALERTRCLESLILALGRLVARFGAVQTSAIMSSFFTNVITGDPYLSITLPGRMYRHQYDHLGYSRLNLSRAVEEGGTLLSPLVPWNAGGAFVMGALGLSLGTTDLLYIPLAFACWLAPCIGIAYAWLGLFSPRAHPGK